MNYQEPRFITSTQLVFDAAVEIHTLNQEITREGLMAATGLKQHVVDERLRVLIADERMVRLERGKYAIGEVFHETRTMSKTVVPGGFVKYDVGDQLIELSTYEDSVLVLMVGGASVATRDEASRQATVAHKLFTLGEPRAMSKTLQPSGLVRYQIGDAELVLSPREDRMLCILAAGSVAQVAMIEANRQNGAVQALLVQRLERMEKTMRDRARYKK